VVGEDGFAGEAGVAGDCAGLTETIDFELLTVQEAREFPELWETIKRQSPTLTDDVIARLVSIAVDNCSVCHSENSRCQCWNDE
jgi:hypothetical protein